MTPTTQITMRADELGRMISRYVEVGYSMAVKAYEPTSDLLRKTDVEKWLSVSGNNADLFRKLKKAGVIIARKKGNGKNSPLYYSKSEIIEAIASHDITMIGSRMKTKAKDINI